MASNSTGPQEKPCQYLWGGLATASDTGKIRFEGAVESIVLLAAQFTERFALASDIVFKDILPPEQPYTAAAGKNNSA